MSYYVIFSDNYPVTKSEKKCRLEVESFKNYMTIQTSVGEEKGSHCFDLLKL